MLRWLKGMALLDLMRGNKFEGKHSFFAPSVSLGTEPPMIRCPFQYTLADTEDDPRGQASPVCSG
jgi:hypothetical protein